VGKVFKALNRLEQKGKEQDGTTRPPAPEQPVSQPPPQIRRAEPRSQAAQAPAHPQIRPTGRWDLRLAKATSGNGPVAESIRILRTRILHPFMGERPRSILVTSAGAGEGKSFVCANLGIALAQGVDNHSLIVDCDLRRPNLHRLFGIDNSYGLCDHLREQASLDQLLTPSGVDKLNLLPAGRPPVNPAELLGSGAMIRLVDELVERYDDRLVLFDSPPLHAAAETTILAQHVDAVVLVVRYGGARREHVRSLVETLGRNRIIGVVFNAYETNILDEKIFGYYDYQKDYSYSRKE
jgi:protein-tyrosine kinase